MAGTKRSRDEFSADSGTSHAPAETGDAHCTPFDHEQGNTHTRKKLKVQDTIQASQELMTPITTPKSKAKRHATQNQTTQQKRPTAFAAAINADEEMDDASVEEDGSVWAQQLPHQAPPQVPLPIVSRAPPQPAAFTPLTPVLAADLVNNRYAPTDATAQQHYLREVGQLQLHPVHTPQQTPQSEVSQQIRDVIYERLFLGFTNDECIPTYNAHGGGANSGAAISKMALPETPKWFAEQNTVLPWVARKDADKKRLKALNLGPKNFPAPYKTKIQIAGPAKAPKKPAATRSKTNAAVSTAGKPANPVQDPVAAAASATPDVEYPHGEEDTESEAEDHDLVDRSHEMDVEYEENEAEPVPDVEFEDEHGPYSPHALVRAALNAFAVDGDHDNEAIVDMVLGGEKFKIHSTALSEYCGLVRDMHEEGEFFAGGPLNLEGPRNPVIVRAFINAISPTLLPGLPKHDFEFDDCCTYEQEQAFSPLNLAKLEDKQSNVTIRKIVWNLDSCIQMYDLARVLNCTVVKDMVTDRILEILSEDGDKTEDEQVDLQLHELCAWSVTVDAKMIRAIAGHHISRLWSEDEEKMPEDMKWPEELTPEQIKAICDLCLPQEDDQTALEIPKEHCSWYHVHGKDETCYRELAKDWMEETHSQISIMYDDLRTRSAAAYSKEAEETQKSDLDGTHNLEPFVVQGEFMQWCLTQEEQIAEVWCQGFAHAMTMPSSARAADEKLQELEPKFRELQLNYNRGVRYYMYRFEMKGMAYDPHNNDWPEGLYANGCWSYKDFNEQVNPSWPLSEDVYDDE